MPPPRAQVHDAAMLITVNARRHRVEEWALRYELPQAEVAKAKGSGARTQRRSSVAEMVMAARKRRSSSDSSASGREKRSLGPSDRRSSESQRASAEGGEAQGERSEKTRQFRSRVHPG